MLYDNTCDEVQFHTNRAEHIHLKKARGLSIEQKQIVNRSYTSGVKTPSAINHAFQQEQCETPELSKIGTYLKTLIETVYGNSKISLGELGKWCEDHQYDHAFDDDKSFVLNYLIEQENTQCRFRFFVTTRRLLSQLKLSSIIMTDATYKLIWQGYPCIVVGVVDNNKSFHPVGFVVCDSEATEDFAFVFSSLKEYAEEKFNFEPKFLVADSSE